MNYFRPLATFSIFLVLLSPTINAQEGDKLVILHTNDLHSRLDGYAPSSNYTPRSAKDDNTIGGFSRIARIIDTERALHPDNLLVLDDGDFLMGTIYHFMEEYNGFQLHLMKEMGYDFVAIGNHEFDFGPEKLAIIIEKSLNNGPIPGLLLSNAKFDAAAIEDNRLEDLFKSGVITRTSIIEKSGIKIGLFSLMGVDADEVAPFAHPVTFSKQKKIAKRSVKKLRKSGVDVVICLSHSGVERDKRGKWSGEDVKLARKVKGIDVIVSGHTHTTLNKKLVIKNTLIAQTGSYGRNVGRIELSVSDNSVVIEDYSLIPVDDGVVGNAKIQDLIDNQKILIAEKLLEPLGYDPLISTVESGFELICDEYGGELEKSNLGPLVVDAIHSYINTNSAVGTDISMVAAGVIRDRIPVGNLSVQDIFRVMSLGSGKDEIPGYPLATVYLTGIELKRMMEILLVSSKSSPGNYCYYSGIEVDFNPEKGLLKKIKSISLIDSQGNSLAIDISKKNRKLYSVSANAYMLEFIGIIKKTTLGLVNVFPKYPDGSKMENMEDSIIDFDLSSDGIQEGKEWIALVEYLSSMDDTNEDGRTELDEFYRNPPLRFIPSISE